MLMVNQLVGFGVGSSAVTTLIPGGTGSAIGNMTASGGLAGAFDGVTNQAAAAGAAIGTSNSGYNNTIGKDWGGGVTKTVTRLKCYAPNNDTIFGASGTTLKLQGSTDNFSSSVVDLYTSGTWGTTSDVLDVPASSITTTTAYRYHRINLSGNGVNGARMAEVEFYEDI